jgi:Glycosyltransferases involved in cell wall biogenesis
MTDAAAPSIRDPDSLAVSVVIAAYNAAATLEEQLDAIATQDWTGAWEVIVVDNASTDGTRQLVERAIVGWPRLRLVDAAGGQGPAYARNVGARAAHGRSLVYCDADDVVAPGWLAAMGNALAVHDFVSGPVELTLLNPGWLAESRGGTGTDAAVWFEGKFPFASSCNLGVTRALFLEQNGFDEALQVGEDIDLSMRLYLGGIDLTFVAGARIHYRYRPDLRATFERAIAYGAAGPTIAELWRARGGVAVSRWKGLRNWAWLVRHVGVLRSRTGRARWLWVAGQRLGSLRGSWTVRRLYV